ncbi:MAG: radical SAM protein, partial [Candidatus Omnitrophica bacterium]|nr:radical SAM protein [Candidatus Omnitrophota bacterium]
LCFPDLYEIGMSYLGMKILYHILNNQPDVVCERVFAPGLDMEKLLDEHNLPLFSLESASALSEFDIVGFSLTYELGYVNVLNMLSLGNIPLKSSQRDETHPLVIAGGTCACNPEPMSDFIDVFCIGEAEEMILEIIDVCRESSNISAGITSGRLFTGAGVSEDKDQGKKVWTDRTELLRSLSRIEGLYVPSLTSAEEKNNGLIQIKRRFIRDLNTAPYPVDQPVPYVRIVQDRISMEIMRGCPGGCFFCQAAAFYRPLRTRSVARIIELIKACYEKTGYEEISLVSLASGCYPHIEELVQQLESEFKPLGVKVALPSLRIGSLARVLPLLDRPKKLSLTVAPEAGTDRMLKLINKDITVEEIMQAVEIAYKLGWKRLKLYFMIGLPEETEEDIIGIADLVRNISSLKKKIDNHPAELTVTISSFIPKPHTRFQRYGLDSMETLKQKQKLLRKHIYGKRIKVNFNNTRMSLIEALLCRGDQRVGEVIHHVWQSGARFEAWTDHFDFKRWQ